MNTPRRGSGWRRHAPRSAPRTHPGRCPAVAQREGQIASTMVQLRNRPRFLSPPGSGISAALTSQGRKEAFSTGIPEPPAAPAQLVVGPQEPRAMPSVRKIQAAVAQGRDQRAQAASRRAIEQRAAMARKEWPGRRNPCRGMGGWNTRPGSCSSGFRSRLSAGASSASRRKGLGR